MLMQAINKARSYFYSKQDAELNFWKNEIYRYQKWFTGELPVLYQTPSPENDKKVKAANLKDASILTWHKLHQEVKYLEDLECPSDAFQGVRLLDVGSGPIPSGTCFKGCHLYCLEPLLPKYLNAGFPLHYYDNVAFIHGASEQIPVEDNYFDAVISVNAIDHVDDIRKTVQEIRRVLKRNGLIRIHAHYHPPSVCEPICLNDDLFLELFSWCKNLKKIKVSEKSHSTNLSNNECFVLWSNF